MPNYVVVVLGDLGRSPRMQNHAVMLSKLPDAKVHLVGYNESPLFESLQKADNVIIHPIKPFWNLPRAFFVLYAPLKILWLCLQFFALLFTLPRFEVVLCQNPPTIPTIPFCWFLCLLKGKRFVIDWHNYGWSILKCNNTSTYKILKPIEFIVGRLSHANFAVTKALQSDLLDHKIKSVVLYDKPSNLFKPSPKESRTKFAEKYGIDEKSTWIISSTSWTPDEAIDMILDASDILDPLLQEKRKNGQNTDTTITFILTGKGPFKRAFEADVKGRNYLYIDFRFDFLTYEDYAELLGCCDAGLSLHYSSSGFDLPMKGLDMIGAGLPLLSIKYNCIDELVHEKENGLLFENGESLAKVIQQCFVDKSVDIEALKKGAMTSGEEKWDGIWNRVAKDVLVPPKK